MVDFAISDRAANEDPGCPVRVCIEPFAFPQWDGPYGIGGTDTRRLYLAEVEYGGRKHLFVAVVEGSRRDDLDAFLPAAERLIASVRVPADPA